MLYVPMAGTSSSEAQDRDSSPFAVLANARSFEEGGVREEEISGGCDITSERCARNFP